MFTFSSNSVSLVCIPPYIYLLRVFAFSCPHPAMANPTPIKSLPVELITEIFVSLDSIADVTHLAETSTFFSNIWKLHAVTICGIILPRKVPSYEKVSELAVAVIRQKMGRGGPAISKAKMTVWLSRAAALQMQKYESAHDRVPCSLAACCCGPRLSFDSSDFTPNGVKLCADERSNFSDFYYELWMLTTMPRASATAILESMPPSQLNPLRRFGDFRVINPTGIGRVSMDDTDEYWDNELDLLSRCFEVHFRRAVLPPPRCWRTISAAY